jgi:hypothetical protein
MLRKPSGVLIQRHRRHTGIIGVGAAVGFHFGRNLPHREVKILVTTRDSEETQLGTTCVEVDL